MDLSARRPGPDVVRALAMAGVVMMNYHGYLILRGARRDGGALYDDIAFLVEHPGHAAVLTQVTVAL